MRSGLVGVALVLCYVCTADAWAPIVTGGMPRTQARKSSAMVLRMCAAAPDQGGREMPRRTFASLFGISILGLGASPASADMTLNSIKRSYFRYVPRIEKGRDLYVLGIRDKIEKKDWEGIAAIFEKVSMAQEDSEKQALGLDAKISKIENELLVPMKVWSTSFAEKGTNPKQRKLDSKIAVLKEALDAIQAAISTKDQAAAIEAWEKGRVGLNGYIKAANKGLTLQVSKVDKIPDDWREYKATPTRPKSSYIDTGRAIADGSVPFASQQRCTNTWR